MVTNKRSIRTWTVLLGSLVLLLQPPWSWADEEQSERLYSQGLIPFHQGDEAFLRASESGEEQHKKEGMARFEEALTWFRRAVAEEPPYPLAVYYLGVTYGKLGRYAEAVPPLEESLESGEYPLPVRQDLAVAYYHLGRYREALALLDETVAAEPGNGLAHYYAGLCHAGLKEYERAIASLERAAATEPRLRPYALHFMGLARLAEGQPEKAAELLQEVASGSPESGLTRRSELLSGKISELLGRQRPDKRWEVRLGIGAAYDSNVILQSDGVPTPAEISDQADLRLSLALGGSFDLLRSPDSYLTGDYDFYQGLQSDLSDFDTQAHKLRLTGGWSPTPGVDLSLEVGSNYYRVGGDGYLRELYALPALGFFTRPWAYTQLSYRWADQDYLVSYYDPARDGDRHELALRQYFLLNGFDRHLFVGYQYDSEEPGEPDGSDFRYQGHLLEAGVRTPGPWETVVDLSYSFHDKDYSSPNSRSIPPYSQTRADDTHRVSLLLRKPIDNSLELYASYHLTLNDSNIEVFEYDRYIISVGFQLVY